MPEPGPANPAGPRPEPLPHRHEVSVYWSPEAAGRLEAGARSTIVGGPTPEFGGREDWWSAQHLLLGSVGLCVLATFQALADRQRLKVGPCEALVEGMLDKTPEGLRFTRILMRVEAEVAEPDVERARNLLMAARRHSLAANSLDTQVELTSRVHGV